ncbi:MAG: glutathione S-transferase [Rhodospirillaceae bacterium]|nr:glutathione S-transferase [Rhodospirillaceae bacterium]|tara:strand:- start:3171 stop:3842 length:672 start_codon:yes stop_codon:yes gene_type:complete
MDLVFIYLDIPFWRAEVGRIALFMGNVSFKDLRITREEFLEIKENGKLNAKYSIPFHQLPCLVVNGKSIAQTAGIARFCGKLAKLYPVEDNVSSGLVDQYIDFATDITVLISQSSKIIDAGEKRLSREKLYKNELTKRILMLEKSINKENNWLVGFNITIADIAIWRLMGWLSSNNLDGIPDDILFKYPKIRKICLNVDNHPQIKAWVKKTYPKDYNRGNFIK